MTESSRNNLAESSGPPLPAPSTLPVAPAVGIDALAELAFDLRSAWNHEADPNLGEPSRRISGARAGTPGSSIRVRPATAWPSSWRTPRFREVVERVQRERRAGEAPPLVVRDASTSSAQLDSVAFFSLEYALSEALPYLLGWARQRRRGLPEGREQLRRALSSAWGCSTSRDTSGRSSTPRGLAARVLPVQRDGPPARRADARRARRVAARAAAAPRPSRLAPRVGGPRGADLALLARQATTRRSGRREWGITAQLYGGGEEMRLLQEMALGHLRMAPATEPRGVRPERMPPKRRPCCLGQCSSARASSCATRRLIPFDVALAATRAGNVFTTHTPVEGRLRSILAGPRRRVSERVRVRRARGGPSAGSPRARTGATRVTLASRWHDGLARDARGSGAVNAVSRRHAEKSAGESFRWLYPRCAPRRTSRSDAVTNGVHVPSWDSAEADSAVDRGLRGGIRWRGTAEGDVGSKIRGRFRKAISGAFAKLVGARGIRDLRSRSGLGKQLAASGTTGRAARSGRGACAGRRRRSLSAWPGASPAYKRPALLLHDAERLARLLSDRRRRECSS